MTIYDGETVVFKYYDKPDGEEKVAFLTVEAFICPILGHIPDKRFKLIRHYGFILVESRQLGINRHLLSTNA